MSWDQSSDRDRHVSTPPTRRFRERSKNGVTIAGIHDLDGVGAARSAGHGHGGVGICHRTGNAGAIRGAGSVNHLIELEAVDGNSVIGRTESQKPRLISE